MGRHEKPRPRAMAGPFYEGCSRILQNAKERNFTEKPSGRNPAFAQLEILGNGCYNFVIKLLAILKMYTKILATTAVIGLLLGLTGTAIGEHPVSIVNANIYVQKYKTTMRLECYAEDLDLLQGVEPLDDGFYDPNELLDAHDDHAGFLAERIEVINSMGEKLVPKVTNIGPFEIPEEGIRQGQLMEFRLQYELEFKHEEPPEFLTINQKLIAEGMLLPSELQIVIQQAGSEEVLWMMKPETPKVFAFDWNNPLSSDASEEEREKWFEAQQDRNLGIASFSSVYAFIYITDTEVRQEVLIPVSSLASFIDLGNADEAFSRNRRTGRCETVDRSIIRLCTKRSQN